MSDNLNTRLSTQDFIQVNIRVFSPKPQSSWLFSIEKYCIYSVCYYVLLNFMSVFHPDYQPQINSHDALNENLKTDLVFPWKTHLLGDFLQEDQQTEWEWCYLNKRSSISQTFEMKTCMMSTLLSLVMKLWKAGLAFYVKFHMD